MTRIRNTNPPGGSGNLFVLWLASWQIRVAHYTMHLSLENSTCRRSKTNGGVSVGRINNNSRWIKKKRTLFRSRRSLISLAVSAVLRTYRFCNTRAKHGRTKYIRTIIVFRIERQNITTEIHQTSQIKC